MARRKGLTAISIENLKAGAVRREIPDGKGLYLVLQPSGAKSWAVRYRFEGKPRKLTLGHLSLAAARAEAASALHEVEQGRDPGEIKKAAGEKAAAAAADTVKAICEEYLKRECGMQRDAEGNATFKGKLRSAGQRARILERLVYPKLGDRPIEAIKRTDIIRLLDGIEDRIDQRPGPHDGARMAHMVLAVLSRIFNWHAARSEFRSPVVRGMSRINAKERARSRILTDDELRAVWQTAEKDKGPFAALVRYLLLTSARRAEAVAMRWAEIDGTDWILPASRNKTKVELVRPLSKKAQAILAEQPRLGTFVFSRTGRNALSGVSFLKNDFDAQCGVRDWRLHDLRRTARSLLSRAGINSDHAERCLGHTILGVRGVYDRHAYHAEMQAAFEALAAQIERIVHPQENVVPIRR